MTIQDQLGRQIQLNALPKRIISLVPSQTELLVDLGLESSLVGLTKFCIHPTHLRNKVTVVGGTKQIRLEKISALQPDIILCNKEENTKDMIASLEQIAPVHVSDINTLEDCFELIKMYGELFAVAKKASEIIGRIKEERHQFQTKISGQRKTKVAYFIWKEPWMVVGSYTFIDTMITEAGFQNIFSTETRYPEIDLSHSKLKHAEQLFLSSEPFPFKNKHVEELKVMFPNARVRIVDGEMFSWYGSRLIKAYNYFSSINIK